MSLHPTDVHQIKEALLSRDQDRLNRALTQPVLRRGALGRDVEECVHQQLSKCPQDVKDWWEAPCDRATTIQEDAVGLVLEELRERSE